MKPPERRPLLLSPPTITEADAEAVHEGLRGGWAAPAGPLLAEFEQSVASAIGVAHAVALTSGTAALELGLRALNVTAGDWVIVPALSFAAPAFAAAHIGARLAFVDVDRDTWTMDSSALVMTIREIHAMGGRVGAIIPVDLYGNPADYEKLLPLAQEFRIPLLEDAAEALGARHSLGMAGSFGAAAVISFNGNKIVTTAGGGMLLSEDPQLIDRVRYWSQQSRTPAPWYEHEEIGYNLRLSSVLASLGSSQVARLDDLVERRRSIRDWYRKYLGTEASLSILDDPTYASGNAWLTVVRFDSRTHPDAATCVRECLSEQLVESRPVFKPLHLQPVFESSMCLAARNSEAIFQESLCLPSGAELRESDVEWISDMVLSALRDTRRT